MAELLNELEQAFASLVTTAVAGTANVYSGKSAGDRALPCVICEAEGEGEEDPKGTGNFWVNVRIRIRGTAATEANAVNPTPADVLLVGTVANAVRVDNLDTLLNAQGRILTVFPTGYIAGAPTREENELGAWEDVVPVRVYCCCSIIAP